MFPFKFIFSEYPFHRSWLSNTGNLGMRSGAGSCWNRQKWVSENEKNPFAKSCPAGSKLFYKDGTTIYDFQKWTDFNTKYRAENLDDHIHQICKKYLNYHFTKLAKKNQKI